jgi:hypothetical protein
MNKNRKKFIILSSTITTGEARFAEGENFAESYISGTRQRSYLPSVALGKKNHSANIIFAESLTLGKRIHSANRYPKP